MVSPVFSGIMPYEWATPMLSNSFQKYQTNMVRYSLTAAVTECSEWMADNTGSPSACCLYTLPKTHTHSNLHACGHTLIISEPKLLSAYVSALSKLFQPQTIQQVTDKSKGCGAYAPVQTCVFVVKVLVTYGSCPCVLPLFLFSE